MLDHATSLRMKVLDEFHGLPVDSKQEVFRILAMVFNRCITEFDGELKMLQGSAKSSVCFIFFQEYMRVSGAEARGHVPTMSCGNDDSIFDEFCESGG